MTDTNRGALAVIDDFAEDYRKYIPQFHAQNRKQFKRMLSELTDARDRFDMLLSAGSALEHGVSGERIDRLFAAIRACRGEP